MRPIVKWAGGKTKLLAQLVARMPGEMRTYAEPFSGGAALFFAIADQSEKYARKFDRAILADRNEDLVITYNAVKHDADAVIRELAEYKYDRDLFYATREKDPKTLTDPARAARLLFLNRTCFNGLWRVNSKGKFNVPFGRYKNPTICDADALRAASRALARADIVHSDFADVTRDLGRGDFIYFDPPYAPVSSTADFTAYAAGGFGHDDQVRLTTEVEALQRRGALVMLSNADTPATRALYKGFTLAVVGVSRSINSDASKRGETAELIVTTWGTPGIIEERAS
ncbi:MAG: DNA adenine methylase [Polyangiaceae bacterium]